MNRKYLLVALVIAILGLLLAACVPAPEPVAADSDQPVAALADDDDDDDGDEGGDDDEAPAPPTLATAKAVSQLTNQPGRAIVSARGIHFIVDSVPPLEGPNEERNPLDLALGALATCGIFIYEKAAMEMDIPIDVLIATVEGDFYPAGVKTGEVNPRIQAFRVHMDVSGPSEDQLEVLADQFRARCPIYTTLERSAPVDIYHEEMPAGPEAEGLATAQAVAQLSNQPGRAIVSARGNHFVVDSVPPLDGPNEERNPLDLMLGALATCGTFIYEKAAMEMDIPLEDIITAVEGDFNPAGVKTGEVNPRIQALRVQMTLTGATAEQAEDLADEFRTRCPIYTTLERSAPIEVTAVTD